jgi:ribosomal subunit interface protein
MQLPLQITFRNMTSSAFIRARVREHINQLEQFFDRIVSCRVVIEAPNRRRRRGKLYKVSLDIKVPGGEIAATRNPAAHHAHEDVYVAIRDAFEAIERRLEDHARRRRGVVKAHASAWATAKVDALVSAQGFGFLKTAAGDQIYFDRNAVDGNFARLVVGQPVRCEVEQGEKGLQATIVRPSAQRPGRKTRRAANKR